MKSIVQQAKKARNEINLPILSFEIADSWMDYLGYEQFGWWLKFHSWVDRSDTKYTENHIPYTLENVFERLNVSQTTFYRKIKVLWESGLIEIVEFEKSERKSQKPKNILVYEYPFHDINRRIKPLEKLRDWKKDYDSQSKLAGIKGALLKKSSTKKEYPPNSERVEKPVDKYPPKIERVDPPKFERVTLPKLGAINCTNKLLTNTNNHNNYTNNNSLSHTQINLIQDILFAFDFTEGEREEIIELITECQLFNFSKDDLIQQAKFMMNKPELRKRAKYFVNGLESNIGRNYRTKKSETNEPQTEKPFYNWLEN